MPRKLYREPRQGLNERRRERYHTDPDFAADERVRSANYRARKKLEPEWLCAEKLRLKLRNDQAHLEALRERYRTDDAFAAKERARAVKYRAEKKKDPEWVAKRNEYMRKYIAAKKLRAKDNIVLKDASQ